MMGDAMIGVRPACAGDAAGIGTVHVAAWRSAYPGILPDDYLARLSMPRQAAYYAHAIAGAGLVYVATARDGDAARERVVGFATAGRGRWVDGLGRRPGEGEVETLYVLDDWRERGLGRALLRAAATGLAERGCRSVFLWVLRENPSRWFYERLGGRAVAVAPVRVGGRMLVQTAIAWDPIERLLETSANAG